MRIIADNVQLTTTDGGSILISFDSIISWNWEEDEGCGYVFVDDVGGGAYITIGEAEYDEFSNHMDDTITSDPISYTEVAEDGDGLELIVPKF